MTKKNIVAIQADSLESLKPGSDSSLFIAAELCKRGYEIFFYSPNNLSLINNNCIASGRFVDVKYSKHQSNFTLKHETILNLTKVHALLIRQDPPFNMSYVTNTYILETLTPKVLMINNPSAIRSNSEKMVVFKFPEFIPPSIVISSLNEMVIEFITYHEQIVIKPLYCFGGKFIDYMEVNNLKDIKKIINSALKKHGQIIIQKFIPTIYKGDKRIIIIDGKAVAAIRRIPSPGNFLANLAVGGTAEKTELTKKEKTISTIVGEYLKKQDIIFAGIDMIDEYLIEVNLTSPTGLVAIEKLYGLNLGENIASYIENAGKN